jgi:predicted AAA+ superfamily ATPase
VPELDLEKLLPRVERLLDLAERVLAERAPRAGERPPEGETALAFRWRGEALEPIAQPDLFPLERLIGVEHSIAKLRRNAAAFTQGLPAVDALLYGERGTGKSSAVRGLLREFGPAGLRLVEVRPRDLHALSAIFAALRGRAERFALFCDDLSFDEEDRGFRELKSALDGGLEARPSNVLILATSNRRHLIPERMRENLEATHGPGGELHPSETTEEKISLSDRFGLLLPFFSFDQQTYLEIVDSVAAEIGLDARLPRDEVHAAALRYALERASRSGRTARQACILLLQRTLEGSA